MGVPLNMTGRQGFGLVGAVGAVLALTSPAWGHALFAPTPVASTEPTANNVFQPLPPKDVAESPAAGVATPVAPTPWPFPTQPENCAPLSFGADGNFSPVTCSDGHPNLQAVLYVTRGDLASQSQLLNLGRYASPDQVTAAACHDLLNGGSGGTIPIVTSEADLAWAENSWIFGGLTEQSLSSYLVDDGCSPPSAPSGTSYVSLRGALSGSLSNTVSKPCANNYYAGGAGGIDITGTLNGRQYEIEVVPGRRYPDGSTSGPYSVFFDEPSASSANTIFEASGIAVVSANYTTGFEVHGTLQAAPSYSQEEANDGIPRPTGTLQVDARSKC